MHVRAVALNYDNLKSCNFYQKYVSHLATERTLSRVQGEREVEVFVNFYRHLPSTAPLGVTVIAQRRMKKRAIRYGNCETAKCIRERNILRYKLRVIFLTLPRRFGNLKNLSPKKPHTTTPADTTKISVFAKLSFLSFSLEFYYLRYRKPAPGRQIGISAVS